MTLPSLPGSRELSHSLLAVAFCFLLAGCPTKIMPPPQTAATIKASELPSETAELIKMLDELSQKHDRVSLENALVVAEKILGSKPSDEEAFNAAWRAARASFWLADDADNDKVRRAWFAQKGIEYGDKAVAKNPKGVEGFYYRAINRGYRAKTASVGAIDMVNPMANDAKQAIALDEKYDGGGPLRLYGMMLLTAPGWPASIGDPEDAMEQLAKSVKVAPEHPLNHLYYGESLIKNDKPDEAKKEITEAVKLVADPKWAYMRERLEKEAREQLARAENE